MGQILAYHLVFGTYGYWLPNDPRGSWSRYVGNRKLLAFGPATQVRTSESVARVVHDQRRRQAAKAALQRRPVLFDGHQARAVGAGFKKAIEEFGYYFHACSIMPDHVHIVARPSARSPREMVRHLKSRATQRLKAEGRWAHAESPWARFSWTVYIFDQRQLQNAIRYVEQNPVRAGKPPQKWSFVH